MLEQDVIPYHPSKLPEGPWLILSPHPDDETIGLGGSIALSREKVWVVMVTDGSKGGDPSQRKKEADTAAKLLGIDRLIWWDIPDREVSNNQQVFVQNLPELIKAFAPKTIFLPSPFEFHPDHRFTTKWAIECLKKINCQGEIWLYEISRQGEVNRLIDITPVASLKQKAIKVYHSQIAQRPYDEVALALNRARSYTLENKVEYAEGFWASKDIQDLQQIQDRIKCYLEDKSYLLPQTDYTPLVSIIIRTKDRPELLKEALQSLAAQSYKKIEAIVVNDGGEDVADIVYSFKNKIYQVKYIYHEKNIGRAAAANSGLFSAAGEWIGLLDDDDILLPEAISTLISSGMAAGAVYGQVEAVLYKDRQGNSQILSMFGTPFSREALFLNNYIPTCGFLFKKKFALKIDGFDTGFYRLEDWDFIYRLAQETEFNFVPQKVAIYRLFNRGFILDRNNLKESPWREKFYKKHINKLTSKFLTHGVYDFLNIIELQQQFVLEKEITNFRRKEESILREKQELTEQLNLLKKEKQELIEQNNYLSNTINAVFSSNSWRLTEPLRKVKLFLKTKVFPLCRQELPIRYQYLLVKLKEYIKIIFWNKKQKTNALKYRPKISIITPVWNIDKKWLKKSINSVIKQKYANWELCIVDGNSSKKYIKNLLNKYASQDNRIKVKFLKENKGISGNSNEALKLATGEFVALLDHDDELSPFALYEIVKVLNENPTIDYIYTDEDKITASGIRKDPFFKPNWSPELLLGQMYTCHLSVFRKSILDKIGGFREGFEGGQDYDLTLRFTEQTKNIYHIPKVLYHWREHADSTAKNQSSKDYAFEAGFKSVCEALARRGQNGWAEMIMPGRHLVHYPLNNKRLISIIIPSKDLAGTLDRCLASIFDKSSFDNFEVIVVDNNSCEQATFDLYTRWQNKEKDRFRVEKYDIPFNFSQLVNYGVEKAKGDIILLLNNDTELITPNNWLEEMGGYATLEEIGCVGAVLLYPDNTIQHAGVILGIRGSKRVPGVAGHAFKYMPADHPGYFDRMKVVANYSAVTGACLMIEKKKWDEVGGFDQDLAVAFNDVDFCLKVMQKGYRNVVLPQVRLYHYESKSRGYEDTKEKQQRFQKEIKIMRDRWAQILDNDPYYNPNLPVTREDFGMI